jgi:hypothetical protein
VSHATQELLAFVRQLPVGMAYAPIYAKDRALQSGKISKGKTPLEKSHHVVMTPADVALQIERRPEVFQAVGVFTGARSGGLVILDVDRNLAKLRKKWGSTLDNAPVITSTKANAAKYLFRVPEALWGELKGIGLSDTGAGYEVLWGRQGLLYGAYPGSSDGKAPAGQYGFAGDLEAIPEAPEWLVAEMRDAAGKQIEDGGFIKNRKALDFSDRDPAEVAEIVQSALRVIPGQGAGSRDHWVKVGMAIHSELPNDLGLTLWSAWSADDPEYSEEWADSNPCEEVWKSFRKGPVSLGTLFWMADQQMPGRLWLSEDLRKVVAGAETDSVTRITQATLTFEQAMRRVTEVMALDDPGQRNFELNQIAMQSGYRDQAKLEQVYVDHVGYKESPGQLTLDNIKQYVTKREYLIPDVLPRPAVVVVYGAGGDGKSMALWTLAKHVVEGLPFVVRGKPMPVQQGGVVILNGDQPIADLVEQLEECDYPLDERTLLRPDWSLQYYAQFVDLMKKRKPSLVIIDSLIGCSGGKAFDENKSEFAMPLYWLTRGNGVLWPAATIMVIHHANKAGGFRGTSAIRDAVTETWSLKRPEEGKSDLGKAHRLITIEKSRCGRSGTQLLMEQEKDLSYSIRDYTPEVDETDTTPASHTDRVLQRVRTGYPRWYTRTDLNSDPLLGGSAAATRKALQRLVKRGLLRAEEHSTDRGGKPVQAFQAVLAYTRGEGGEVSHSEQKPSAGREEQWDTQSVPLHVSHCSESTSEAMGHTDAKQPRCPIAEPSNEAGFARNGTPGKYPRASEERTSAEMDALKSGSSNAWPV